MATDSSINEEILSHMLIGALHEKRLYSVDAIMRNESLRLAFRNTEGFRFYLLFMLLQAASDNRDDMPKDLKSIKFDHIKVIVKENPDLTSQQKAYKQFLDSIAEKAKGDGSKGDELEKWTDLEAKNKSEVFEPSAPPPAEVPLFSPTESFIYGACLGRKGQGPWCPFSKRAEVPPFSLERFKPSVPVLSEPSLVHPYDGFVEVWVMWLIRLCNTELEYQNDAKVAEGGSKISGRAQVGGFGSKTKSEQQLPSMFEYIVVELVRYMTFDPVATRPLIEYAQSMFAKYRSE